MTIPVKQAEGFAIANGLSQVIIFGHDGKETHVLTWGDTPEHAAQAAFGANAIKKQWGWPEDTQVESAKVAALRQELDEAKAQLNAQPETHEVHVVEGTEYERGWGSRPDGIVCFTSRTAAETWIAEYNRTHNNQKVVPGAYTAYTYIGVRRCSPRVHDETHARAPKFLGRHSDLMVE